MEHTRFVGLVTQLSRGGREKLPFASEAGPCGYEIQRQIAAAGQECEGVAPSWISKKVRDRGQKFATLEDARAPPLNDPKAEGRSSTASSRRLARSSRSSDVRLGRIEYASRMNHFRS